MARMEGAHDHRRAQCDGPIVWSAPFSKVYGLNAVFYGVSRGLPREQRGLP